MKAIKSIVTLAVLLTLLSCGDDLLGPFGDLTPPCGGWLWVVKTNYVEDGVYQDAIYKVDVSTGKWIDVVQMPYVIHPNRTKGLGLAFGDGKLWVNWDEYPYDPYAPNEYYYCWIDPETEEYGPAIEGGGKELAWDGSYLWRASDLYLRQVNPYTGEVIEEFDIGIYTEDLFSTTLGLTWDGSELCLLRDIQYGLTGKYSVEIWRIDPDNGDVLERVKIPLKRDYKTDIAGLTWDGEAFWTSHTFDRIAYRISTDGDILGYFEYDFAGNTWGLAWEFPDGTGN